MGIARGGGRPCARCRRCSPALVFVLLPIQAESVAWVTGRVDSLPACFYFASFLLYVRSIRLKADATDGSSPDAGR